MFQCWTAAQRRHRWSHMNNGTLLDDSIENSTRDYQPIMYVVWSVTVARSVNIVTVKCLVDAPSL